MKLIKHNYIIVIKGDIDSLYFIVIDKTMCGTGRWENTKQYFRITLSSNKLAKYISNNKIPYKISNCVDLLIPSKYIMEI